MGRIMHRRNRLPNVPAKRGTVELLKVSISEEERQLERLRQAHDLKLRGGGKGLSDVPAIESPAEAH
jgi:hypothetical protein